MTLPGERAAVRKPLVAWLTAPGTRSPIPAVRAQPVVHRVDQRGRSTSGNAKALREPNGRKSIESTMSGTTGRKIVWRVLSSCFLSFDGRIRDQIGGECSAPRSRRRTLGRCRRWSGARSGKSKSGRAFVGRRGRLSPHAGCATLATSIPPGIGRIPKGWCPSEPCWRPSAVGCCRWRRTPGPGAAWPGRDHPSRASAGAPVDRDAGGLTDG